MTTLNVQLLDNKTAYATGMVVVVEPCQVVLKGYGDDIADLRVRFCVRGREVARFPLEEADVWTDTDGDAVCEVNTNTVEGLSVFKTRNCSCDLESYECLVLIEDIVAPKALICSFKTSFKNWPQVDGAEVPYSLAAFPDTVAALQDSLAALQAEYDAHDHSTDDPQQVAHSSLVEIGDNSHADIDAALSSLTASLAEAQDDIVTNETEIATVADAVASHVHNGTSSQQLAHSWFSGIGTKSHDQLEALIAAGVASTTALIESYEAHKHTGGDGTVVVSISDVDGWAAEEARIVALEGAVAALTAALAALDAEAVKKQTTLYTVTAPVAGIYRNINEDMSGDELARAIPTIVADLKARGIL
jgi:hypothetical protein